MIYDFGTPNGYTNFTETQESYRSDTEQSNPKFALWNPDAPEIKMARARADEIISVSGAELKIYTRTDNADYDAVWDEDPDPTYWTPFIIKGVFKPNKIEIELKAWGADSVNRMEISFSHLQIYNKLGPRMLRAGDVIQVPYNSTPITPKNFRVVNATPSGMFRYVWLYMTCQCEALTADMAVRPEQDMQGDEPEQSGGRYMESV